MSLLRLEILNFDFIDNIIDAHKNYLNIPVTKLYAIKSKTKLHLLTYCMSHAYHVATPYNIV